MKKIFFLFLTVLAVIPVLAQEEIVITENTPVITYGSDNKKYAIADIQVTGAESLGYENFVLQGISNLSIGQKVSVPGDELTAALRAYLKHGLFSWGQIVATKQTADSVWLEFKLRPNPIISTINYSGVKKGEKDDLETKIGMARGTQLTPNLIDRAKKRIKSYFDEKGFSNADVVLNQHPDLTNEGKVILDVAVNKNQKTKIQRIFINGNEKLTDYELKRAMKKTNEAFSLKRAPKLSILKMFSTKKFVDDEYKTDLNNIIDKYNEKGYREAEIVADSVVPVDDKRVNVYITVSEGEKYYLRNINWIGNTLYPTEILSSLLDMKPKDVYNLKKLNDNLQTKDDAVANLYYNNGYIFANLDPVEVAMENDSVDLEIRIREGMQASINRIGVNGNDRLYEDVVRRELVTKPGQVFSKEALIRSAREISQMGHFDPEAMQEGLETVPNPENGTMDINYNLVSKANDQVEFSAGWGQTGIIGRMSLKFSNFSVKNFLHPSTYRGIIPQGEGQTLTLSGQTNGRYYQSYSVSFMDPWFGGKRPNSFSLSAYYMSQTGVDSRSYSNSSYGYGSYGGYGGYGSSYGYDNYTPAYDENTFMRIFGLSAGYGKRLNWPDNYFTLSGELTYQHYWLRNWQYFLIQNGNANSLTFGLTLGRNSTDNPLYTRSGSSFALSVNATPPYSLFDGVKYDELLEKAKVDGQMDPQMYKWIEYHKWKMKAKIFIPLAKYDQGKARTPVLMSRIEYGFLGTYNKHKNNPFETFYMGGSGMSGYSSIYANETVALRGYDDGSLTPNQDGYAYSRLAMELRYPFMLEPSSTIYGLAFVEAGNAWSSVGKFNPFDLKRSAGVGVRIFLPMIGLMGIDWAYGFDKPNPSANKQGSWFGFIIGQEF